MNDLTQKQEWFEKSQDEKRIELKAKTEKELERSLGYLIKSIKKEGKEWVVRTDKTELRNQSKKEALRDLATINNYRVIN